MAHLSDRRKDCDRRHLFVNTGQASEMLGGLLQPHVLRDMARKGEIKGAVLVRQRVLIPISVLPSLVRELEYEAVVTPVAPRRGRPRKVLVDELAS